jgi:hypothetical protein
MAAKLKVTARKWMGDDAGSWAVFLPGQSQPFVSGLTKAEVPYYKSQGEKIARERGML